MRTLGAAHGPREQHSARANGTTDDGAPRSVRDATRVAILARMSLGLANVVHQAEDSLLVRWSTGVPALLAIAAAFSLVLGFTIYLASNVRGAGTGFSLPTSLGFAALYGFAWAAAAPPLYRIATRWPMADVGALRYLGAHAALAIVASVATTLLFLMLRFLLENRELHPELVFQFFFASPGALVWHSMNVSLYVVLLSALVLIRDARRSRSVAEHAADLAVTSAQLEAQLNAARLEALRLQISPHFLFNALNSTAALIEARDNAGAYRMIGLLGDFLRATLEGRAHAVTPLGAEIDLVQKYIAIEQVRFGDRLRYQSTVESEAGSCEVPTLMLQPLLENVLKHAVAQCSRPVRASIAARVVGDELCVEVSDDGPGLSPGWSLARDAGLGISNVRERLATRYGGKHSFEFRNRAGGGLVVGVRIPAVRTRAPGDAAA
ncbi:MAG: histidine kinase [Gammaproteobacteria bacterium]|nr:histidine kinase [Gammaproteobacteria bacterium]